MVSEEHRNGLYITVPVYFVFLGLAAFWAYRRMERMKHDEVADKLSSHYLGGRDFGPFMTAGTLFASLFSGYTVIGTPNDSYYIGFLATSWIPNMLGVVTGYFGTGLRLLRTSLIRNHQTPADFVTDRYQSQILRYTIVFLQVLPTLIYLSAQVVSIQSTFNSIFELDPDATYPVIIIMTLILIFEWVGGLSSVALTDCIQAVVMVSSFIVIPSIILKNYGGWTDLDPETYPKPYFYQTPSQPYQWLYWQFAIVNFSFFTLPHLVQRTYAAKTPQALQVGYTVMAFGPWLTTLVGLFMGTIGVVILADDAGNPALVANPFASILEELMDLGTFAKMAGVICVTASLAAIMSTADSLIIAISQLITVEIVHPLRPSTTPSEIGFIGKFVSLCAVGLSVLIGILWDEGVSDLGTIQFSISAQALPTFLCGLYSTSKRTDIHPWCLFVSAFLSTIYVFTIYFGYIDSKADAKFIDAGITGLCINVALSVMFEGIRRLATGPSAVEDTPHMMMKGDEQVFVLYPGRPEWDVPSQGRFGGSCLTSQQVWDSMKGINEPMANPWWCLTMFLVLSLGCPWTPESQPPFAAPGGESKFLYSPPVVNGLPWWVFRSIVFSLFATAILLVGVYNMPKEFPSYNGKVVDDAESSCAEDAVSPDDSSGHMEKQKKLIGRDQTGSISEGEKEEAA